MAAFSYEGDHAEVTQCGVTFPRGVPVEVDHPVLLRKLPGNGGFKAHDAAEVAPAAEPEPKPTPAPAPAAAKRKGKRS